MSDTRLIRQANARMGLFQAEQALQGPHHPTIGEMNVRIAEFRRSQLAHYDACLAEYHAAVDATKEKK